MAPDLLRWGDDLISVPADYNDDLFEHEFTGVSESDEARARARAIFKDKFTSSIVADKSYLCDFKIIPPLRYRLVLPIFYGIIPTYLL